MNPDQYRLPIIIAMLFVQLVRSTVMVTLNVISFIQRREGIVPPERTKRRRRALPRRRPETVICPIRRVRKRS